MKIKIKHILSAGFCLLMSVVAHAYSTPVGYEYWFDNNRGTLVRGQSGADGFEVDADDNGLNAGLHTVYYRMMNADGKWGHVGEGRFFVPGIVNWAQDNSSRTPVAYRSFINGEIVDTGVIESGTTEFEFQLPLSDDIEIRDVYNYNFNGEGSSIRGSFEGSFDYGFQMLSSANEWGAPLLYNASKTKEVVKVPDVMEAAASISVVKPGESDFLAYKIVSDGYGMYLTANQSCQVCVFGAYNSNFTELGCIGWYGYNEVQKGLELGENENGYVVVIYDCPVNAQNPNSDIEIALSYSNGKTPAPKVEFDYNTNLLTMSSPEEGTVIYYTLDGSTPSHESSVYSEPIKVEYNLTARAIAWTESYGDSNETMLVIDPFAVPYPELVREGAGYIFTNSLEGVATYYTLDGSDPKLSPTRILFDGTPFEINEVCTVMAYSTKENFKDSGVFSQELTPKCATPKVATYDGHYVTLSCSDPRATIYYSDFNTGEEKVYNGEALEIPYFGVSMNFYAMIPESDFEPSDSENFYPEYYSKWSDDDTQMEAYIRKPDMISKSFGWVDPVDITRLKVITRNENWNYFAVNDADFAYLRSLPALRHIDLTETSNTALSDNAFAGSPIISLVLPESLTSFGATPFSGCENLSCLEIRGDSPLPADLFAGMTVNPNLLMFVPKVANAEALTGQVRNIVGDDAAPTIVLTDGYQFSSTRQFFANEISYTKNFSKRTPIGGCAGWEAISLPFTVSKVTHEKGELGGFTWGVSELQFWMYNFSENVWRRDGSIHEHESCIISMPNNENYYEEYNLAGDVTFKGEQTYVQSTSDIDSKYFSYRNSRFKPNYSNMEASDDVMVLNDETYLADGQNFEPGSVFVAGLRGPRPFEAYMLNTNGARYMKIAPTSGIDDVMATMGFQVWTEGREICVSSEIGARVRIFDAVGRLVTILDVKGGETARTATLAPGIYIVGDSKIMLK